MKFSCALVLCLLLLSTWIASQENQSALRIPRSLAEENLVSRVDPVYPEIAREANVQGKVVLSVVVSAEGRPTSVKAVEGHPLLVQPAIDAVRKWEFRPYVLNGQPHAVTALVDVVFSMASEEKASAYEAAAHQYHLQEDHCNSLLLQHSYAKSEPVCAALPELSEKLDPILREDRVRAYRYSGTALFAESKLPEALAVFLRELQTAKAQLDRFNAELGRAHIDAAHVLQVTGEPKEAKSHYEDALKVFEHDSQYYDTDIMKRVYASRVRPILRDYARLLRQMGFIAKAEAVEKKERALGPEEVPSL